MDAAQPDLLAPEGCATCGVDPCACVQLHLAPETPDPPRDGEGDRAKRGGGGSETAPDVDNLAVFARLWASPSVPMLLNRRAEQWLKHGHSPEADLAAPLDRLPRAAAERLHHALDKLGGEGGDLDYAIRKLEIAGACIMAALDQLLAVKAARGGE